MKIRAGVQDRKKGGKQGRAAAAEEAMLDDLLQQMASYLVDEDVHTISVAQSTLRQVGPPSPRNVLPCEAQH